MIPSDKVYLGALVFIKRMFSGFLNVNIFGEANIMEVSIIRSQAWTKEGVLCKPGLVFVRAILKQRIKNHFLEEPSVNCWVTRGDFICRCAHTPVLVLFVF